IPSFAQRLADTVSGSWAWNSWPPFRGPGSPRPGFGGWNRAPGFGAGVYPAAVYPTIVSAPYDPAYYSQPQPPPVTVVLPRDTAAPPVQEPSDRSDDQGALPA